ncbi:MAG: hypothetical protein AVDCRST_MAG01-01-3133 [uncultured Rubrobacteraceae bacterium]|uniref:Uncharacterized protein n=1 Tax=uncultured Rubrobacteraceae bacterium TaxID=349277 RepID=A0A6J4QCG2_9ACTN|nr:MAG: hypothetical protein AVDCRST_MAG01-01-3133 [uncultured Rubrobacteraceae bacterium]
MAAGPRFAVFATDGQNKALRVARAWGRDQDAWLRDEYD